MVRSPDGVRRSTSNSTWKKSTSMRSLIRQKQELMSSSRTTIRRATPVDRGNNDGSKRLQSYYDRVNTIVTDALNAVPCEEDLGEGRHQSIMLHASQLCMMQPHHQYHSFDY